MGEVWLVCHADVEYNDEYNYFNDGYTVIKAFGTELKAQDYCRERLMESTPEWLPDDCIGDTNQERRMWWVKTYGDQSANDPAKGYYWDDVPVISPKTLRKWCEDNNQDPLDFLPAVFFVAKVPFNE